jgi:hypothetical protein
MQPRFGPLQYAIIALTVVTAAIHLVLAPRAGWPFWLNGFGYLTLLILLYWPSPQLMPYRAMVRWLLIAYTIVTIVAWFTFGTRTAIAYFDKTVEVILVALLWIEGQVADSKSSLSQ